MKKFLLAPLALLVSGACCPLAASVQLPALISDHMVLKRGPRTGIWGKASPGEKVSVTLGSQSASTQAGADGKWRVEMDLQKAPAEPLELVVQGENTLKVSDVLVGEVWVGSGQSNMEWRLQQTVGADKEMAASANPMLRLFTVTKNPATEPLDDVKGQWQVAAPDTVPNSSAVGYYFAKTVQQEIKAPLGFIHTSWGGTPSEAWTSPEAIDSYPDLKAAQQRQRESVATYTGDQKKYAEGFTKWLADTGRADKPNSAPIKFTAAEAQAQGWTAVKLPGKVKFDGFEGNGEVWLCQEFDVPADFIGRPALKLDFGAMDGFEQVYLNDQLVKEFTPANLPGGNYSHRYDVPGKLVKEKGNVLAIRVFAPLKPVAFPMVPKLDRVALGDWQAKAVFSLPAPTAEQTAAAPTAPTMPPDPWNRVSALYNGMLHPLLPAAITGVVWYQGESNIGRAWQYRETFPLMIADWRSHWKQGDFPFYLCQLANHQDKTAQPGDSSWAELREAQSVALKLPHTGMAVLLDLGDSADIHPRRKREVGERLALIALAQHYGRKLEFSGPVYQSMKKEDKVIRLSFTHVGAGLEAKKLPAEYSVMSALDKTAPLVRNSPGSELEGFSVAGADRQWHWANARIDGDSVVVSCDEVPDPVAVRYGWANNPTLNLYNKDGLPASSFRTDDFPATTQGKKY